MFVAHESKVVRISLFCFNLRSDDIIMYTESAVTRFQEFDSSPCDFVRALTK